MPSCGTLISEEAPKPGGRVNAEELATSAGGLAVAASEDGSLVAGWAEDWVVDLVALLRGRGGLVLYLSRNCCCFFMGCRSRPVKFIKHR